MSTSNFESWVWTELLAFDNSREDMGVEEYLNTLGFVPKAACLLFSSPDFFLLHENLDEERDFSLLFCSREAHPGNENRLRQQWTNFQLKKLIKLLADAGCACYISCFPAYFNNKYHTEWMSQYPESRVAYAYHHLGCTLNALAQLNDGRLVEDIIIKKVVKTCLDYGFAGWHGPDGWGPYGSGNIMGVEFSDSMMKQFLADKNWELPPSLQNPCPKIATQEEREEAIKAGKTPPDYGLKQLQERATWIWENKRLPWIEFNVQRWKQFWEKMTKALHSKGLKNAINSAWTKGNFDALYDYGIDYREMAKLGIDAMVVEAVALGMNQIRPHENWYHDDYAVSLAEIKAAAPDFKLIFLHGIKDVVENWDNLRHAQPGYERELYKLSNLYYRSKTGLQRSADGLLACLADGIEPFEWDFIRKLWQTSFVDEVISAGEITALWHDSMLDDGLNDFIKDGFLPGQKQCAALMRAGLQLQTFARFEDASEMADDVLLVPAAHLVPKEELKSLLQQHKAPVILIGRAKILHNYFKNNFAITDSKMALVVYGMKQKEELIKLEAAKEEYIPTTGDLYFSKDRMRQAVAENFWTDAVLHCSKYVKKYLLSKDKAIATIDDPQCTLITRQLKNGAFDVAIENRSTWGRRMVQVNLSKEIKKIEIISSYPLRCTEQKDKFSFSMPIPPRGIATARIYFEENN